MSWNSQTCDIYINSKTTSINWTIGNVEGDEIVVMNHGIFKNASDEDRTTTMSWVLYIHFTPSCNNRTQRKRSTKYRYHNNNHNLRDCNNSYGKTDEAAKLYRFLDLHRRVIRTLGTITTSAAK